MGNNDNNTAVKKRIVIVGGGSTGWIAAAALGKQLKPELYAVTLVESSAIGTIGVGEAVIPPFVNFIRNLGLDEQDFIRRTQASFKLGIKFQDWLRPGQAYFHHFGALGRTLDGHDFLQCWLKAKSQGDDTPLMDYAPAAVMAKHHRFYLPFKMPKGSPFADANYAFHFDAALVAKYLRDYAQARGVVRVDARVEQVQVAADDTIRSITLDSGESLSADLFLDCSGFRGLLIGDALKVEYQSWKQYLPCDRAVALQTEGARDIPPYTLATARDAGWTWRIPLQHRVGNGYVFSADHCSDDEAVQTLLNAVAGEPLHEPRVIPFKTGMRKQLWKGNCVTLGLAGGFLEPLESTAIHLVTRGVQFLLELFPRMDSDGNEWRDLATEYNNRMAYDYKEIRDFIILHYCTTQRNDTAFWRDRQLSPIPDSLVEKIQLFAARGEVRIGGDNLFKIPSWQAVFTGMEVIPKTYHPFVDMSDFATMHLAMKSGCEHLGQSVHELPDHADFLREHCPAQKL